MKNIKDIEGIQAILDLYGQTSKDFQNSLRERTTLEVAYDDAILFELKKGTTFQQAVETANKKHPSEALTLDKNNIDDAESHYRYLLNHEAILEKIRLLKEDRSNTPNL